ncbi:24948_t:CDS:2 [Racocetra persica]|uniref:24948_t:CDS:1 n=1 Tax=Racocetra persica TaxID=160502 RepID=A0ACA9NFV6_9GLOM|nr:24948_t:CDS:2 [Racocetra persica]
MIGKICGLNDLASVPVVGEKMATARPIATLAWYCCYGLENVKLAEMIKKLGQYLKQNAIAVIKRMAKKARIFFKMGSTNNIKETNIGHALIAVEFDTSNDVKLEDNKVKQVKVFKDKVGTYGGVSQEEI